MTRTAARLLTAAALAWVAIVIAAPLALAHGYVVFPALVYEAAGLICHQRPERSFHLGGIQLPVCARCLGLYASGATGALAACVAGFGASGEVLTAGATWALALAAFPTAATVALEWAGWIHPGGVARAVAAVPLGALAGWLFVRALGGEDASARRPTQVRYHS